MKKPERIPLLKECYEYSIGLIKFVDNLTENGKEAIAKRLYTSCIGMSYSLLYSHFSSKSSEYAGIIKRAAKYIDETIYWLKQCQQSSSYPHNEELLAEGLALQQSFIDIFYPDKN
ncbi:MAG TPA: hypothetical protein PLO05_10045 [Bacteroidales bacterium]|jgi:hypothetical protein|nr:hypothetical protein [Bacteroidales bacterium]MDY0160390.1 hypothetical protein [Bacteroidales bacterium]HXK82488.1 hypothetical protein [Bacteroidales bacterium]